MLRLMKKCTQENVLSRNEWRRRVMLRRDTARSEAEDEGVISFNVGRHLAVTDADFHIHHIDIIHLSIHLFVNILHYIPGLNRYSR
ncbi:hypothetical protein E2C01_034199 [Portunus trituberculatus]|uniref:Uncharacterized protein n=1 Tax=Portunus trituberculatus TaxID=210409 RepID=A0A5B7F5I7_PORTR|nr:hypothetical protein [Portunus trituberculatus]